MVAVPGTTPLLARIPGLQIHVTESSQTYQLILGLQPDSCLLFQDTVRPERPPAADCPSGCGAYYSSP